MIKLFVGIFALSAERGETGEQPQTPLKWLCTLYPRVVKAANEATLKIEIFNTEIGAEDLEIFR
jgi:hypothetical protein